MKELTLKDTLARKVLTGVKTTTLRTKRWPDGEYEITINKKPVARVELVAMQEIADYRELSENDKANLASWEGGFTVPEFEELLRKISFYGKTPYADFLTGKRKLWLHRIDLVEVFADGETVSKGE